MRDIVCIELFKILDFIEHSYSCKNLCETRVNVKLSESTNTKRDILSDTCTLDMHLMHYDFLFELVYS